jgi:hypothetical protein
MRPTVDGNQREIGGETGFIGRALLIFVLVRM